VTAAPDPVGAHVTELDRLLRGPTTVKRSMIAEVRDGLADAVAAHRDRGLDPERAAAAAIREFGSVHEVAALLQDELTARQGRRTALLLVVTFPALLLAWDSLWLFGPGWTTPPTPTVSGLARTVDALTALVAVTAGALLLTAFRDGRLPRWVTGLTGVLAVLGILGTGGLSLVMNLLTPHEAGETYADNPATAAVLTGSLVCAVLVTRSAARSLRFARGRRRSDEGADPEVG
jgi:hypothetical protein